MVGRIWLHEGGAIVILISKIYYYGSGHCVNAAFGRRPALIQ